MQQRQQLQIQQAQQALHNPQVGRPIPQQSNPSNPQMSHMAMQHQLQHRNSLMIQPGAQPMHNLNSHGPPHPHAASSQLPNQHGNTGSERQTMQSLPPHPIPQNNAKQTSPPIQQNMIHQQQANRQGSQLPPSLAKPRPQPHPSISHPHNSNHPPSDKQNTHTKSNMNPHGQNTSHQALEYNQPLSHNLTPNGPQHHNNNLPATNALSRNSHPPPKASSSHSPQIMPSGIAPNPQMAHSHPHSLPIARQSISHLPPQNSQSTLHLPGAGSSSNPTLPGGHPAGILQHSAHFMPSLHPHPSSHTPHMQSAMGIHTSSLHGHAPSQQHALGQPPQQRPIPRSFAAREQQDVNTIAALRAAQFSNNSRGASNSTRGTRGK